MIISVFVLNTANFTEPHLRNTILDVRTMDIDFRLPITVFRLPFFVFSLPFFVQRITDNVIVLVLVKVIKSRQNEGSVFYIILM
jgi:hypothetical protein